MELTLFDFEGVYVGSVFSRNGAPPPIAVVYDNNPQRVFVSEAPRGARAGGIPRYVEVNSIVTTRIDAVDQTPTPREREGRRGRRR